MAIVRTTTSPGESTPDPKKQTTAKPVVKSAPARPGVRSAAPAQTGNAGQFINETRVELNRVVWPTRVEVRSGTIVTIGLLVFFAIYVFGLDYAAEAFFKLLGLYGNAPTAGSSG